MTFDRALYKEDLHILHCTYIKVFDETVQNVQLQEYFCENPKKYLVF